VGRQGSGGDVVLTSFVGRRRDLDQCRRLLGAARLVTLVGPGGVGKTRLARRLTDEVSRSFPDGTFLVELSELHDPEALVSELASSLGVEDIGTSHAMAVSAFVRDRRLLLVLDNCEHLVEATARLVHGLLHESTGLRVVATSRQPLGVVGEQLFNVEPLSLPHEGQARETEVPEAVQLFVERARLVVPAFDLTPDNAALVGRVCTTLDGMPLAIELAAARLRLLSLAQLAERLVDRFGVLAVAATAALPRHQTLRASVDWSFDLCSADEQTLWAWMSAFEGGADLDAVEALCTGTRINVFDTVAGLVDKSVLTPREAAGRVRYQMLDTIRAYGRERLDERGDTGDVAERHRAYFVEFARSTGQAWFGPDQRDAMARTAAEHANLRAAFESCLSSPHTHQDALTLTTSIWWFWVGHGGLDELWRWLSRALEVPQPSTSLTLHATSRASFVAAMRADYAMMRTYAERALALDPGEDSPAVRWDRRWGRTCQLILAGDAAGAAEVNLEALRDDPPPGRPGQQEIVNILTTLAQRRMSSEEPDAALDQVDEGIEICRRHGDEWSLSFLMSIRGARLADAGRHVEALAAEREALRLARGGFNAWAVVHALEFTAQIYAFAGQSARAAVLFGALTGLWSDVGGVLTRSDQSRHADLERETRSALGDGAFDEAFDRGRRLSLESLLAFVLDEEPGAEPPVAAPTQIVADLTPRELQVAELVARGLSNKDIAHALVVSPRTAEGHVARLLVKLGFDSRARVAAWVAERRAGGQ
jgi:non-specific serine/threonine protein kinase